MYFICIQSHNNRMGSFLYLYYIECSVGQGSTKIRLHKSSHSMSSYYSHFKNKENEVSGQ